MTARRCRWHLDGDLGRCPNGIAFPGYKVPELCIQHLTALDPWIEARSRHPAAAEAWIHWARRQAQAAEQELLALGAIRPARALDNGRPVIPDAPERR
jgi:hypothetical protein